MASRRVNMITTYEQLKTDDGETVKGRTKLFIIESDEHGNIVRSHSGTTIIPEVTGTLFIVDDWLIPQLQKVKFSDGVLSVKDGEKLTPPVKTEKELQREALLKQLAELDSQPSE